MGGVCNSASTWSEWFSGFPCYFVGRYCWYVSREGRMCWGGGCVPMEEPLPGEEGV